MPKIIDSSVLIGDILHEWSVSEYDRHERNRLWFVLMTVFGIGFVTYALMTDNFLFALVIVLFAIILFLQTHQDPIAIPFKITEIGIVLNNRIYSYSELDEFYIIYNPSQAKTLFIETLGNTRPRLRIPLVDEDPNQIRDTLKEFLEENLEKEDEPFSDLIARIWKLH